MWWHTHRNQISSFGETSRVPLNRRGASVQSTTGSRSVRISGSNVGYTMFRGSVKGTGYPLHSQFSPSLPLPCVTGCHHISTGVYIRTKALVCFLLRYPKQCDVVLCLSSLINTCLLMSNDFQPYFKHICVVCCYSCNGGFLLVSLMMFWD